VWSLRYFDFTLLLLYFIFYRGLNPEQAEMKFLNTCKDLRRYGQHLFAVYVSFASATHYSMSVC